MEVGWNRSKQNSKDSLTALTVKVKRIFGPDGIMTRHRLRSAREPRGFNFVKGQLAKVDNVMGY